MLIKHLGLIEYEKFLEIQNQLTPLKENILIFCYHYPIFTIGKNEKNFQWAKKVDRGGSITYFDEGILMVYFIFNVTSPLIFYRNIKRVFDKFFENIANYNKTNPGYYIDNKKIASIGFSYKASRSNHGIAININPNLDSFNKINPCNLQNIKATSFEKEKIEIKNPEQKIIKLVKEVFNET